MRCISHHFHAHTVHLLSLRHARFYLSSQTSASSLSPLQTQSHLRTYIEALFLRVLVWWLFMGGRRGCAISGQLINHTGCGPLISSTGTVESSATALCCLSSISLLALLHCGSFSFPHVTSFPPWCFVCNHGPSLTLCPSVSLTLCSALSFSHRSYAARFLPLPLL